jgi:hypothetical protein
MLGVWFAVLGGLFVSGVALVRVLVSEYTSMGESGSVRLIWGLFGVCLTRIRILGGVCSVVRGFLFFFNAVYHLGEPNEMIASVNAKYHIGDANQLVGSVLCSRMGLHDNQYDNQYDKQYDTADHVG